LSKRKAKDGVAPEAPATPSVSLAAHPRARVAVRRLRGRCGIGGFVLVGLLCLRAGVPGADAALRALVGGIVAYFAAWACGIAVYRQLVVSELRHAEAAWRGRMAARAAEIERINAERVAAAAAAKAARA
jgi:hypothetical protein